MVIYGAYFIVVFAVSEPFWIIRAVDAHVFGWRWPLIGEVTVICICLIYMLSCNGCSYTTLLTFLRLSSNVGTSDQAASRHLGIATIAITLKCHIWRIVDTPRLLVVLCD